MLKNNFVVFAPKKADIMYIASLKLGDNTIEHVNHAKCLGIINDEDLDLGHHIDHIIKNVARGSNAINLRNNNIFPWIT